ncbi:hypothetical protein GCM10009117_13730 [Gangjinia marincola]|uniref:Maltokinase n=1 Tax=Gangjinia marincola TaxID=578463 RepID=A0ABN1MGL8_9FLAO
MAKKQDIAAPYVFNEDWYELLKSKTFVKTFLEDVLEPYIIKQRWYGGKASSLKYVELVESFTIENDFKRYYGLLLEVNFKEAFYQHYFIPIAFVEDASLSEEGPIMELTLDGKKGYIIDGLYLEEFRQLLFEKIVQGNEGDELVVNYHSGEKLIDEDYKSSKFMGLEQSNTSIIFNERYVIKFFRRIYVSTNPDYEISRFLTEVAHFKNTPAYTGSINLRFDKDTVTLALMQELIPNEGDAWQFMLKELDGVIDALGKRNISLDSLPKLKLYKRIKINDIPPEIIDWAGLNIFLKIKQLAIRTAEMHVALGSEFEDNRFAPTRYNSDYTVWLKNRLLYQFQNRINLIENNLHKLEGTTLELAQHFLENKNIVRKKFIDFDWTSLKSERIRIHGDYHLGQVLVHGDDFYLLDFEGEPESTIRDRKVKQPPLKDVASMFRSFHYAIYATIFNAKEDSNLSEDDKGKAGEILYRYFVGVFLQNYIHVVQANNLNIGYNQEIYFLLKYCLLEKAVYELGYELNSRPRWAIIPLKGIENILRNQDN